MVMENTKKKGHAFNRRAKVILTFLIIVFCLWFFTAEAEGATLKNVPSTDLSASYNNKLVLGYHNYTAKWNGVSGKMIKGKYNYDLLCVPVKTTTTSFTYTDFLDLTFTNVGKINGRQLDAKVHFNSMTVSKANTTTGLRSDNYFAVCYLADESLWLSSTVDGIGAGYRAAKTIDITTTIYWHDTGKTVNLPFFQCLQDIDAGANYFKEAWESKSGYSGVFYKYSTCFLIFSGNKAVTPSATDVGGTDSLFKGGFYAPTTGGVFRGAFTEGNSAAQFIPYSAYTTIEPPVKASDGRDKNEEGEIVNYTITKKMGRFYVDTMTVYTSLVFEDRIPDGLAYENAAVYDGDGNDITSHGTLTYDDAAAKVTFTMGNTWLSNIENYNGKNLVMKIAGKVKPLDTPVKIAENTAEVIFDSEVKFTSNKTEDILAVPYHVHYEYVSGTEGRELPESISTETGDYAVKDDEKYYQDDKVMRKDMPPEGTVLRILDETGKLKESWVLAWDDAEKTIESADVTFTGVWRYVPAPRVTIAKEIKAEDKAFIEAHGNMTFIFRLTGADSGKEWYKSITFTKEILDKIDGGKSCTDSEGNSFEEKDGCITGSSEYIYLPEDDYFAEELNTLRFKEVSVEAYYIKSDNQMVKIGQTDNGVEIPLKVSSFKQDNPGYDSKGVRLCFENIKIKWDKLSHTDLIINKLKGADSDVK